MIVAARRLTHAAGKKLYRAMGNLPSRHLQSMRSEGGLSKEDYEKFQEEIRTTARDFLKMVREESVGLQEEIEVISSPAQTQEILSRYWGPILSSDHIIIRYIFQVEARQYLNELIGRAEGYLQDLLDEIEERQPAFQVHR